MKKISIGLVAFIGLAWAYIAFAQTNKETIEKRRIEKAIELGSGDFAIADDVNIDGNVGIGTSSLTEGNLTIQNTVGSVSPFIALKSAANGGAPAIDFYPYNQTVTRARIVGYQGSATTGFFRFFTHNGIALNETFKVSYNGNASVSYDSTGTYLNFNAEDANGDISIKYGANTGTAPDLIFRKDGGGVVMTLDYLGNARIGSSAPSGYYQLEVDTHAKVGTLRVQVEVSAGTNMVPTTGRTSYMIICSCNYGTGSGVRSGMYHLVSNNEGDAIAYSATISELNGSSLYTFGIDSGYLEVTTVPAGNNKCAVIRN